MVVEIKFITVQHVQHKARRASIYPLLNLNFRCTRTLHSMPKECWPARGSLNNQVSGSEEKKMQVGKRYLGNYFGEWSRLLG